MNLHREILEAEEREKEEIDPERKKNQKEVEKLIKQLEADSKKPRKKKSYEMSLGEADAAYQENKKKELDRILSEKTEISQEEFERLQSVFQKMGGKIVAGGKSVKDSLVVEFPAKFEKEAKKIKSGLERRSSKINIILRKEGGKVFLTMRGNK